MAQATEEVMGFAEPTLAERRAEVAARAAFLFTWLALNGPDNRADRATTRGG